MGFGFRVLGLGVGLRLWSSDEDLSLVLPTNIQRARSEGTHDNGSLTVSHGIMVVGHDTDVGMTGTCNRFMCSDVDGNNFMKVV